MPWLKYRHKFAYGKGSWEWRDLGDQNGNDRDLAQDIIADVLPELTTEYEYSDKYRGVDYEVVELPPRWLVEARIEHNNAKFVAAEHYAHRLDALLKIATDCEICADLPTQKMAFDPGSRISDCPQCGRSHVIVTYYPAAPKTKRAR